MGQSLGFVLRLDLAVNSFDRLHWSLKLRSVVQNHVGKPTRRSMLFSTWESRKELKFHTSRLQNQQMLQEEPIEQLAREAI